MRAVTEKVFPLYYPALMGHLPPVEGLAAPGILPSDWPEIESKILAPWLQETTAVKAKPESKPGDELAAKLAAYMKNRGR